MFRIIGAHFRKVGRKLSENCGDIAAGIERDDDALKRKAFRELRWQFYPRLVLWGAVGVLYVWVGHGTMADYLCWVAVIYIAAIIIARCTTVPEPPKQEVVAQPSDELAMKHAKEGRNALLDYISIVCESLAEQTEIYSPGARDELAYPSLNRCIHIEKGVAVVTVQLHYAGDEIDPAQFKERFNDRMAQKLDSGELSGKPPALFYDKDNTPHTAIQAIRCVPFKSKKYIRLDVVRVNEAALALMDEVERESQSEVVVEEQLTDDEL